MTGTWKMDNPWCERHSDPVSRRSIWSARDVEDEPHNAFKKHDTSTSTKFQVRSETGEVLLRAFGESLGEYGTGMDLYFVEGSDGKRVRLDQSNGKGIFCDVPDAPSDPPVLLKHYE